MTYGEALELLKQGKKVSCNRWGTEGNVYVIFEYIEHKLIKDLDINVLLLVDTNRNKAVTFTPSVENQIEDEWYEVELL